MECNIIIPKEGAISTGVIVNWRLQEGARVNAGDILCEVDIDKTAIEIESPVEGILSRIFYKIGEEAPVLVPICMVEY